MCMCVCVAFSGWKLSTVLIQLIFPQKEGKRETKKNRYNSKILMAREGETLANK